MNYSEVISLRKVLIEEFRNSKLATSKKRSLNDVIKGITGVNTFITIYHFQTKEILFCYHVLENIGYTKDEFTIEAINNAENNPIHIIHPHDIEHKLRYDLVMYQLMAEGVKISSLADNYKISLRIIDKQDKVKRVSKQSYIFEVDENGTPLTQLDIWRLIPNDNPYVSIQLNSEHNKNIIDLFYKKNRELLGIKITERQMEILKLRNQRLDNKSVASHLFISVKTVENHIRNLTLTVKAYCDLHQIDEQIYNMNDLLHFIIKYGIFSFVIE